jgi:hypothetical protein
MNAVVETTTAVPVPGVVDVPDPGLVDVPEPGVVEVPEPGGVVPEPLFGSGVSFEQLKRNGAAAKMHRNILCRKYVLIDLFIG